MLYGARRRVSAYAYLRATVAAAATVFGSGALHAQEVTTYGYDALGRLANTGISGGPQNGTASVYTFDRAGNRTNVSVTGVGSPTPTPGGGTDCTISVTGGSSILAGQGPFWVGIERIGACSAPTVLNYSTRAGSVPGPSASGTVTISTPTGSLAIPEGTPYPVNSSFYIDVSVVSGAAPASFIVSAWWEVP